MITDAKRWKGLKASNYRAARPSWNAFELAEAANGIRLALKEGRPILLP
jgi:hypothetical protein